MKANQRPSPVIHVCLISEQPIPNLLPLLIEKPQTAVLLVSPQMSVQAERLREVLQPRGISVEINAVASAFDFESIVSACEAIEKRYHDASIVFNVTGGTKIAALAAFQVFYFANRKIIYLDTANGQLLELAPENRSVAVADNHLKICDYLRAYGMIPIEMVASSQKTRTPALKDLVSLFVRNNALLGRLNASIAQNSKNSQATLSFNELGAGAEQLADLLVRCNMAVRRGNDQIHISSSDKIFFCHGGWLEEFVFWTVKDLGRKGLDLAMNVKVKWDGSGSQTTENEFDVVFTCNNRLHLISCKAANPKQTASGNKATDSLHELDALADRAGGLFGKAMLVSARKLREADRERAKKMRLCLVDGPDILRLKEFLGNWLGHV